MVNRSGIINISLPRTIAESVSNSTTPQNILLTYPILIEVIQITAHMSIWIRSLIFALIPIMSSKKLIAVIRAQNIHTSRSLKLYSTERKLSKKKDTKKIIPIL